MSDQRAIDRERVEAKTTEVREVLRAERRRTVTERRAFEAFANRVADVELPNQRAGTSDSGGGRGGHGAAVGPSSLSISTGREAPVSAVRRAYEETVMAVSFYDTEYGDDYEESLREEFGPEVATAVTDPDCFGPAAKSALVAAVKRATAERAHLIETCEHERESIDGLVDTLLSTASELDTIGAAKPRGASYGSLEARWTRLKTLRERCEAAAVERQAAIDDRRERHALPIDEPDICAYLYQPLDVTYPILSVCASLAERATSLQRQYERAIADC